jgi:hypothetical protein
MIMTITRRLLAATSLVAATIAQLPCASAHHSGAAYDGSQTLRIEGEVHHWRFGNPHSSLQILVADTAGEKVLWSFEGLPAGMLTPLGYRRNTFEPASQVAVWYNPMRDGMPGGGRLVGAVLGDGSVVGNVPSGETDPPSEDLRR